jgi:hypothetical protein
MDFLVGTVLANCQPLERGVTGRRPSSPERAPDVSAVHEEGRGHASCDLAFDTRSPISVTTFLQPTSTRGVRDHFARHSLVSIVRTIVVVCVVVPSLCCSRPQQPGYKASRYLRDERGRKVIVFVPGVLGDSDTTWENSRSHTSWPELIKQDDYFRDFDIFVAGYASPAIGSASTINEIATRVLQELFDWKVFGNHESVIFLAHSMGGLVVKRMRP